MLLEEWNMEDAKEVWQEEAREEGLKKGQEAEKINIARNAMAKGLSVELIQEITGLSAGEIEKLKSD